MNSRSGHAGFAAITTVASIFFSIATIFMAMVSMMIAFTTAAHAAWPPPLAPASQRADEIRVDKSERRMELLRKG